VNGGRDVHSATRLPKRTTRLLLKPPTRMWKPTSTLAAETSDSAGCGNLRPRWLLTVCIVCNLCRPQETYVNVGFRSPPAAWYDGERRLKEVGPIPG
jgi:hypothetical protein